MLNQGWSVSGVNNLGGREGFASQISSLLHIIIFTEETEKNNDYVRL